ncbi:MAG: tyrosine-type recombinase/integrase, partial [Nitriliruptorales bacterium]|nr:tyrosine-type recombinase/integrase [Nitriliruptorales bacterium]
GGWRDRWGLVFTHPDGHYVDPYDATVAWRELVRQLDLPVIRLHDLRHTHATLLLQAGASLKVVSERLGHSGIELTVDTYLHVLPAMDADAVDRFAELLDRGSDRQDEGWSELRVHLPDRLRQGLEQEARRRGQALAEVLSAVVTDTVEA